VPGKNWIPHIFVSGFLVVIILFLNPAANLENHSRILNIEPYAAVQDIGEIKLRQLLPGPESSVAMPFIFSEALGKFP
jgi:hypothetical protein